ncbi:peptide/nickel transport system permease protein [Catenulispora sp. EB89]|uniref:ABC transporter permease n=1 Tax=Catenulispora sp. EB89 TaxID=3156257 RepID=UPI003510D4EF
MTTLPGDASTLHDDFGEPSTPEPGTPAAKAIEGRSLTKIAWTRLKRDKVAMSAGCVVVLMCLLGLFSALIYPHLGGGPQLPHSALIDGDTTLPTGTAGGISAQHWLGVDPTFGRDLAARIVEGAKWSLLISFASTILTVILGLVAGLLAGYFGGWVDSVVNWLMAVFLAFPVVLFGIALVSGMPTTAFGLNNLWLHVVLLILIIGGFGWAYFGRIVRGQVLTLREKEFVDASRSLGAGELRIVFKEIMPNLIAPILVFTSLQIPANILAEAAFSFLGVGIPLPHASWGGMLNDALNYYEYDPAYLFIPGIAIFVTVLAFNLFGDGVRDAFDPKAGR